MICCAVSCIHVLYDSALHRSKLETNSKHMTRMAGESLNLSEFPPCITLTRWLSSFRYSSDTPLSWLHCEPSVACSQRHGRAPWSPSSSPLLKRACGRRGAWLSRKQGRGLIARGGAAWSCRCVRGSQCNIFNQTSRASADAQLNATGVLGSRPRPGPSRRPSARGPSQAAARPRPRPACGARGGSICVGPAILAKPAASDVRIQRQHSPPPEGRSALTGPEGHGGCRQRSREALIWWSGTAHNYWTPS